MKRIFTLVFAVGMMAAAEAQPGNRDNRQQPGMQNNRPNDNWDDDRRFVTTNISFDRDDRFNDKRISNERKRSALIAQINREYDYRIQKVRNNFFLSRWEKEKRIRFLQDQRQQEIRRVYQQFNKRNQYDRPGRRY